MYPTTLVPPHAGHWRRALGVLALMLVLALALGAWPSPPVQAAYAVAQPRAAWVTDGEVSAVAQVGNTIYLGGNFHVVGPPTGSFVALENAGAAYDPAFPVVTGEVSAVAADGSGGWFIGGSFTAVAGHPRNGLAHISADKTLDPVWNPTASNPIVWSPTVSGEVPALAVSDSTVFVGGWFTSAGGQVRNSLAAFDATTGLLTAWDPNIPGSVFALAVRGNTVYAGGDFTSAGGQVRNNLAALDATTGLATAWDPITAEWLPRLPNSTHKVSALDANGPALVVGGAFRSIGDTPQSGVAIFPVVPPIYLPLIVR